MNGLVALGRQRKLRKPKKPETPVEVKDIQDAIDVLLDDDETPVLDACARKHCGAGKECKVNADGDAECRCIAACPEESDPRRMVTSLLAFFFSFSSASAVSDFQSRRIVVNFASRISEIRSCFISRATHSVSL